MRRVIIYKGVQISAIDMKRGGCQYRLKINSRVFRSFNQNTPGSAAQLAAFFTISRPSLEEELKRKGKDGKKICKNLAEMFEDMS